MVRSVFDALHIFGGVYNICSMRATPKNFENTMAGVQAIARGFRQPGYVSKGYDIIYDADSLSRVKTRDKLLNVCIPRTHMQNMARFGFTAMTCLSVMTWKVHVHTNNC